MELLILDHCAWKIGFVPFGFFWEQEPVEMEGPGGLFLLLIMAPLNCLIFRRAWILQAKSVNDVTGIGLHETRRALEAAKESMASLKQSELIDKTINWLAIQEQKIAK